MVHERLTKLAAEAQVRQDRRMGYLKLVTIAGCVATGVYLVAFHDFKDRNGNDYEHCFMPIRRVLQRQTDAMLGVDGHAAAGSGGGGGSQ